jgi:hypothetical protein
MHTAMKTLSLVLLLGGLALAQPPGPPGPPPGGGPSGGPNIPTGASSGGGAANLSFPHVVGTLSGYSPTRFTIQREMGSGGPTANMDFSVAPGAFIAPGLKSGTRAIVVYQMNPKGEGYQALGVVGFPSGTDPTAAIKGMPKLK